MRQGKDKIVQVELTVGKIAVMLIADVFLAVHYYVVPTLERGMAAYASTVAEKDRLAAFQAASAKAAVAADGRPRPDTAVVPSKDAVVQAAVEAAERHAAHVMAAVAVTLNVTVGDLEVALARDCTKVRWGSVGRGGGVGRHRG